jgi:type I restriction-modification system DNA methylase subunit
VLTEADTCRTYIVPKLHAAGWEDDFIAEQRVITPGRIVPLGKKHTRQDPRRPDYILFLRKNYPLAVVEAKAEYRHPAQGMQQAIDYAHILGLKFAYASNGTGIVEHDFITGKERTLDKFPVTNPPFGGEEEAGIQLNFPEATRTSETALLFMQFIMRSLKPQGRCALVVPNGTLFGDGVAAKVKEKLLTEFNLHTIVRLPNGVFAPYTSIPTNRLFFDRTGPTHEIWYYEQPMPEGRKNYSKTKPMQHEEWAECIARWDAPRRIENDRAWKVAASEVLKYDDQHTVVSVNLDLKNPTAQDDFVHLPPEQLAADILKKEQRIAEIMAEIQAVLRA